MAFFDPPFYITNVQIEGACGIILEIVEKGGMFKIKKENFVRQSSL